MRSGYWRVTVNVVLRVRVPTGGVVPDISTLYVVALVPFSVDPLSVAFSVPVCTRMSRTAPVEQTRPE